MQSINWLLTNLERDFPALRFIPNNEFLWSANKKTIYYDPTAYRSDVYTLHELSHAILGHRGYDRDIELIKMERDAWQYMQDKLSKRYGVTADYDHIQDNLDTYRSWLHARSACPQCKATGLQTKQRSYKCITCSHSWRVNEARICALRRYSLSIK